MAHSPRLWWSLAAIALLIALALTFYAGAVVRPKVDAIRTAAEEQNPDAARKAEFQPVRMGVGVNTGLSCVGNVGSEQRL